MDALPDVHEIALKLFLQSMSKHISGDPGNIAALAYEAAQVFVKKRQQMGGGS